VIYSLNNAARVVLTLANADEPSLRLPLAKDALERIPDKNAFVEQETARWRTMAQSTGYKEGEGT